MLNSLPTETINVFHFTADKDCCTKGDRIPAMWVYSSGNSHISSAVGSNGNYYIDTKFELGQKNHIIIQQLKEGSRYFYEIKENGTTLVKVRNKNPQSYSKVKLYTSSPWMPSIADLAILSNFSVQGGPLPGNETVINVCACPDGQLLVDNACLKGNA